MVIGKSFSFEAAHMLSEYDGPCANLHGHSYQGSITIRGDKNPETEMVLDYNVIKRVINQFDHATLFSSEDIRNTAENELYDWVIRHHMKYVLIPGKCTAENIALYLQDKIQLEVPNCKVTVQLQETKSSFVEV